MKEARIEVYGRVQGVGFRNQIKRVADDLGLKGSVMNLSDGGVLIIAQGEDDRVNKIVSLIRENPGFAKIEDMDVNWSDIEESVDDFKVVKEGDFLADKSKSVLRLFKRIFGMNRENEKFDNVPRHVTIIPDGNRRWARFRGLEPQFGHYKAGSYSNIERLLKEAKRIGVKYVSIWGFSTENWKRDEDEKRAIFDLISGGIARFMKFAKDNRMRFKHIGRKDRLPKKLIRALENLERETLEYDDFSVLLCLDYGGRDEILRAVNKVLKSGKARIGEEEFSGFLDTNEIPDVDLIIRTSGEQRLSGFMPFQSAYAELHFSKKYFPEFGISELHEAVKEYARRQRRFGGG